MTRVTRSTTADADTSPQSRVDPARPAGGLRIAVFAGEFPALSETFVLRQVDGLLERGHDVTVFADRPRDEPFSHPDFEARGLAARTRYIDMPATAGARARGALQRLIRHAARHPRAVLRALNVFRLGRDAATLRRLYWTSLLLEHGPFDALHCHFGPIGAMVAELRAAGAVEGRLATTFHGADLTAYLRDRPDFYRPLAQQCELALPISDVLRQRLIGIGWPENSISVLHMGVDTERFGARAASTERSGPMQLLSIGRLVDKKGFADALQAVATARREGCDLRYTIVGDGPLRQPLEMLTTDLKLDDLVVFRGWQQQDAIVEALYAHDVLMAPSVTAPDGDQEGIPVTLMEAMATGMPVISTRHSGIPELVEDGVSGLLAEEGDHLALADAIDELAADPALARRMGQHARQRVQAEFDAAVLDAQLDRELRALANRPI